MKKQTRFQPRQLSTLGVAFMLLVWGCDRTKELAESERAPARAAKLISQSAQADATAVGLLEKCAAAYKRATSYQDNGRVVLGYKVEGQATQDVAPLSVAYQSPNRLGFKAYQVVAGSTDTRFRLRLNLPTEPPQMLARQVISRALPTSITMPWLMSDTTATQFFAAGLAGSPPQFELLFGDQPFRTLLEGATSVALDGHGAEAGQTFQIVKVMRGPAAYRLWISSTSSLLRRIELPTESLPPVMLADKRISDLHLSIELDDPKLGTRIDWSQWQVADKPLDQQVRYFVMPPEVELDSRLGKALPGFKLPGLAGGEGLDTTANAQAGKVQVLVWAADHPSCRMTLDQIKSAIASLPPPMKTQVVATAVWAEPDPPSGSTWADLVRDWQLQIPLVQDIEAAGRDVLGVAEAPTVVILDNQHRLQLLQPRANPMLADALPALLARLASGENLAGDMVHKNTLQRQRFAAELWLARASDATISAFTQPSTYPPGQLSLELIKSWKQPIEVVAFQADAAHNLWLLNSQGRLVCSSSSGQVQKELDTQWTFNKAAPGESIQMAIDSAGAMIALTSRNRGEILLIETANSKRAVVTIKQQNINDLRWLNTAAGLRLAAVTEAGKTLLIDPQRAQQHSGQSATLPLAILPRPKTESLASGLVILTDGRIEPIIVQDEGGARPAALAQPVSVATGGHVPLTSSEPLERQLKFKPARGPWSPWTDGKSAATLARGWLAHDEPGVYVLDQQLRQLWHAPLPVEVAGTGMLVAVTDDPVAGGPIWAISTGDTRLHFFNGDGRLVDHCQITQPVRGLALIPAGQQLQLWVAHQETLMQYAIR